MMILALKILLEQKYVVKGKKLFEIVQGAVAVAVLNYDA